MKNSNHYHLPELDGLRAIAILLVIVYHWFPEGTGINILPNGPIGVTLFFVLSGFLISQILLRNKQQIETQKTSVREAYRIFVIRRALRIFPVYYLTLLGIFVLTLFPSLPQVQTLLLQKPLYYFLYGSNFLITFYHNWKDQLSPFWSLAVEEQFYIFFPLIIFLVPKKWLLKTILGFIVVGILSRILLIHIGDTESVLTPTCFDAFGLGALWAYFRVEVPNYKQYIKYFNYLSFAGLLIFCVAIFAGNHSLFYLYFMRTAISLVSLYFIVHASEGFKGWFARVLNSFVLKHIGQISYGIYIFHILVPSVLTVFVFKLITKFTGIYITHWGNTFRFISFILLIIVANLSWHVIEKPLNNLKKHF